MQPLVGMGWLDAAKGTVSASGVFKHDESVTSATCDLEVACESLTVVKGRGVLEGVSLKGALGWQSDKALSGQGEARAAKLVVGSIALSDVAGSIQAEGDVIKAAGLTGSAFGGTVTGDAEFGALQPGLPAHLTAQLKGINLESVSRDLAIPSLYVTGNADGMIRFAMEQEGMMDLQITLESVGAATVSVAALEQLLTSPYVQEFTGKKQLERIVKEVVGKEKQSSFDSAKLALAYGGDRYILRVKLVNAKVNLTVDVLVDASALMDALKLIQ